jgi:hypothetical protein
MEESSENIRETQHSYTACAAILLKEIELLEKITPVQALLRDAVLNREWTDFERLTETIAGIGAGFERLEAERTELFKNLTGVSGGGESRYFYAVAARLPPQERERLTSLYRRLKMEALRIKLANDTLMNYIKETRSAISGILENAYPDRKGKIYSRTGMEREADMKSVLLNHSF